ncbi:MAG: hypothetical protein Q4C55_02220 [Eubacterium sp.]|nr:hypothetical protein [Eubacterium sp.]
MKKLIGMLLAVLMLLSASACDMQEQEKAAEDAGTQTKVSEEPTTVSSDAKTEENQNASEASAPTPDTGVSTAAPDVDLTTLNSTMVYSEVFNMTVRPEDYVGKTVKMRGQFAVYEDTAKGKQYFACVIMDATACCAQGIEFVLSGDHSYPEDYPPSGEEITVQGVFQSYVEDDYTYIQLVDAAFLE